MSRLTAFVSMMLVLELMTPATAKVIYVNNRTGDDVYDGSSAEVGGLRTGPVRTLARAQVLVGPGDEIEIANTGDTYFDTLHLVGRNASGVSGHPTVVRGNGAVLDGSEPIAPGDWKPLGQGLWRLDPREKGWFQLIRETEAVEESQHDASAGRPAPAAGTWSVWKGSIYYQALPSELPPIEPYRLATREAGIFLYGVHDVIVRDLTVRYFRLDGVNAHDQTYRVLLRNIVSEKNGRSGVFVGGSSELVLSGGATRDNRAASLLIKEQATAEVRGAKLDEEPVLTD